MRKDENLEEVFAVDRQRENETACCVRNDGSGCVQVRESQCSVGFTVMYIDLKYIFLI